MQSLIDRVVFDDSDSAANPTNVEYACLYALSNYRLCEAIKVNGKESTILMDYLQKQTRNFDFSEVHPCENCGEKYCDNELCKECSELIPCENCSDLVTECDLNKKGICSNCVDSDDMYAQQNEYLN